MSSRCSPPVCVSSDSPSSPARRPPTASGGRCSSAATDERRCLYEIDAFHEGYGIVVEVEAGRGARGNATYRDIIRASLILDAQYLALLVPVAYRHVSGGREVSVHAYKDCADLLSALYASQRLRLPFLGTLLIGY